MWLLNYLNTKRFTNNLLEENQLLKFLIKETFSKQLECNVSI